MILADRDAEDFGIEGLSEALSAAPDAATADLRIFGKPATRPGRRMGVALASGVTTQEAVHNALAAASKVRIVYR